MSEVKFIWLALMVASSAFQAGASILKVQLLTLFTLFHTVHFTAFLVLV